VLPLDSFKKLLPEVRAPGWEAVQGKPVEWRGVEHDFPVPVA